MFSVMFYVFSLGKSSQSVRNKSIFILLYDKLIKSDFFNYVIIADSFCDYFKIYKIRLNQF